MLCHLRTAQIASSFVPDIACLATIENYVGDGNPVAGKPDENRRVERDFDMFGRLATLRAKNLKPDGTPEDQETRYV